MAKTMQEKIEIVKAEYEKKNQGLPNEYMNALYDAIQGFVWKQIWKKGEYAKNPDNRDEMFSEAITAVVERCDKWNPRFALTTFFGPTIQGALFKWIAENVHHLNKNDISKHRKILAVQEELLEQGIEPTIDKITRIINDSKNYSREVVKHNLEVVNMAKNSIRLDETPSTADGGSLVDVFLQDTESPAEKYEAKEQAEIIQIALHNLDEIEEDILRMIYFDDCNLRQISKKLGISESKVKKARTSAILKMESSPILRRYMGLKDSDDGFSSDNAIDFTESDMFGMVSDSSLELDTEIIISFDDEIA